MRDADPWGEFIEIIEAIDRIESYVVGLDAVAFSASSKEVDAVAMNLVVVGEAVRRLDGAILGEEPAIHWPAVVAVRNRIAHGYSSVQRDLVWEIVKDELPLLRAAIQRMMARHPPPQETAP